MPQNQLLTRLECLLENLPVSTLYCDTRSTSYNFSVSNDDVEKYGNKNSAINHMLEVTFGPCRETDGIVPIRERGPGICAVVPVLDECSTRDPADKCIKLWIGNLCSSAEELYTQVGERVRSSPPVTQQRGLRSI